MKCREMAKFCFLLEARDIDIVSMCIWMLNMAHARGGGEGGT